MGEVYRARDSKLNRDVALKVLLPAVANDPDRLARFSREAQVLASLNHPNIAHIHGIEDASGVRALVMELVEGPTLADRIARGPIPLVDALPIAKQIAEALEAAHERGIIHRDLKPANIKVRADGAVKVLDFGLAAVAQPADVHDTDAAHSPTMTAAATRAGVIMGTAAYMAPEQAAGKPVDKRADIWAFGVVLWEMLSGKKLFDGETISHTLADVLRAPIDFGPLPRETPEAIRDLLRRCLNRDARHRLRDIGDARIEIEEAGTDAQGSVAPAPAPYARLAWVLSLAVAALLIAALAIPAARYWSQTLPPEMRLQISTPSTPAPLHFALSPDARYLVFVASGDGPQRLWLRALDNTDARPMAGTDGAEYPFWSADSRSVGFFASGKLYRIDIGGGPPRSLADAPNGRGGTWNAEGTILYVPTPTSAPKR